MPEIVTVVADTPLQEAVLRDCLAAFPHARLTVVGECMAPRLRGGETVLLQDPRTRRPRIGDVVLVRQPEGLRLHRLVWGPPLARFGAWRTQADRGRLWDTRVRREDVIATVVGVERGGRTQPVGGLASGLRLLLRGLRERVRRGGGLR